MNPPIRYYSRDWHSLSFDQRWEWFLKKNPWFRDYATTYSVTEKQELIDEQFVLTGRLKHKWHQEVLLRNKILRLEMLLAEHEGIETYGSPASTDQPTVAMQRRSERLANRKNTMTEKEIRYSHRMPPGYTKRDWDVLKLPWEPELWQDILCRLRKRLDRISEELLADIMGGAFNCHRANDTELDSCDLLQAAKEANELVAMIPEPATPEINYPHMFLL